MRIIHFFIIFLSLALTLPAPSSAAPVRDKLLNAESFTLSNGMQVVLVRNTRAPVITQMVWYKVGAADEESGKTGLAHFLEHLMFKGSPNVPSGEFSKRVRALGGTDNAFTAQDYTAYHQSIAVQNMDTVMTMEADRMKTLLIPAEEFEAERQVVLEERRERTENDPRAHLFEQMRHALFPGHPYGTPVIGWEADIRTLTRQDALDWHVKWYNPANAILVVSGDTTVEALRAAAEKAYGAIPAHPVQETVFPAVAAFPAETLMVLRDPRVHQPQFTRLYRAPGYRQNKQDSLALDVLQEIMSGNPSTRLYKALVVEQKLATGISLSYQGQTRDTGHISLSITPAAGIGMDRVAAAAETEIVRLATDGITAEELDAAKTRLKDSAAFARDSLSGPAQIIGAALATGMTLDDVEYWTSDIDGVTAAQVQNAARQYLVDNTAFVTGHILVSGEQP